MGQGAATSGQGLTAMQVAAALRATARSQQQRAEAAATTASSPKRTQSGITAYTSHITQEDCEKTFQLSVPVPTSSGGSVDVHVTEYAPDVFAFVRHIEGVSGPWFTHEWSLPEEQLKMELGEGRSQALFLKSKNMAFMCKTIAEGEVHVLLRVLREYAVHLASHPNSLLMRFYMLMKVQCEKEVGYILCFNDVFGEASILHEKWDIKGRIPKPGKYLYYPHLVRHAYEPDPYLIETPHSRDVIVSTSGDRQRNSTAESTVMVKGSEDTMKLTTLHDKDLTRLFWLPPEVRKRLLHQLFHDYEFLQKAGLMDYSLLIGVAYQEKKTSRSGKRYLIENMKMTTPPGEKSASPRAERRQSTSAVREQEGFADEVPNSAAVSEFVKGVHSLYDQEIYYVGIIDMLTSYTVKKKSANLFKSFLWEQDTLSTIPPKEYGQRITSFTKLIFPQVESDT